MKKLFLISIVVIAVLSSSMFCKADDKSFLYIKPGDKPQTHILVDENVKCITCHPIKIKGIDGYTSATMTLKNSKLGVMPKAELEKRIVEVLTGRKGREIYVLSTSYKNKPLATIIEFCLDQATLTFYSMSEKQTEKLFQIHENDQVSFAYVKPAENYFKEALGVQIVGKAQLLTGKDPEFEKGLALSLLSLPLQVNDDFKEKIRSTKILTKITPERIVLRDSSLKAKGLRPIQIWERGN